MRFQIECCFATRPIGLLCCLTLAVIANAQEENIEVLQGQKMKVRTTTICSASCPLSTRNECLGGQANLMSHLSHRFMPIAAGLRGAQGGSFGSAQHAALQAFAGRRSQRHEYGDVAWAEAGRPEGTRFAYRRSVPCCVRKQATCVQTAKAGAIVPRCVIVSAAS